MPRARHLRAQIIRWLPSDQTLRGGARAGAMLLHWPDELGTAAAALLPLSRRLPDRFGAARRRCAPAPPTAQQPQIILLKEGTDTSQGKPQLISNINACMALADTVRTTLGPRGMDKLIHDDKVRSAQRGGGGGVLQCRGPAAQLRMHWHRACSAAVCSGSQARPA